MPNFISKFLEKKKYTFWGSIVSRDQQYPGPVTYFRSHTLSLRVESMDNPLTGEENNVGTNPPAASVVN
jgi:hypothetical protein